MNKLIAIVFLISGICSCTKKVIVEKPVYIQDSTKNSTYKTYTEREKQLAVDSAVSRVRIECDSLGRAYIKDIEQIQGQRVNQDIQIATTPTRGEISLLIKSTDRAKETIKESNSSDSLIKYKEIPVPYKVEVPVNYVTGWQWFWIYLGRILLMLAAVVCVWQLWLKGKVTSFKGILKRIKSIFN